jgi:serine/threonine-protein kinase
MPDQQIPDEGVRAQVTRVLRSPLFASATALADLVRFTVEKALSGESDSLKEYSIGTAVFHRGASFDPVTDSIVRVQARKLRKRLEQYYETEGKLDPVRIQYTPGSYVPHFLRCSAPGTDATGQWVSIAVLPFLNLSPELDSSYFCDGLTEDLIYVLSKNPALKVVARASSYQFKGVGEDVRLIGAKLGAQYVVDGTVQKSAGAVRVTVGLVNVSDGYQVWAERYDRKLADILQLQAEVAQSIGTALSATVSAQTSIPAIAHATQDAAAYDVYLKGRYYWNQRTDEGFARAVQFYEQALLRDPGFAKAHAGMAETYALMMMHNLESPVTLAPRAKAAAQAALAIDPELASVHAALALVRMFFERDPQSAEIDWRNAIRIDPDHATAWHWFGVFCLTPQGRFEEALEAVRLAERLDPFSVAIANDVGFVLYWARQYDGAIEQCRKAFSLNAHFYRAHYLLGRTAAACGRFEEAIEHSVKARALIPGRVFLSQLLATLGFSHAAFGDRSKALSVLGDLRDLARTHFASAVDMAIVETALGQRDEAFASLREALAQRTGWIMFAGVEPLLDGLRDDPRFRVILDELRLTSRRFAAG